MFSYKHKRGQKLFCRCRTFVIGQKIKNRLMGSRITLTNNGIKANIKVIGSLETRWVLL